MTQLGKVAPPVYRQSIVSGLNGSIDVCPPGSGGSKPLDRGRESIIDKRVALLFLTVSYYVSKTNYHAGRSKGTLPGSYGELRRVVAPVRRSGVSRDRGRVCPWRARLRRRCTLTGLLTVRISLLGSYE
eukprot:1573915-Pyramimonas_sp.AAC.1